MKKTSVATESRSEITVPKAMRYAALLDQFGAKDRQNFERLILACETKTGSRVAEYWRRLACLMMTLAPVSAKLIGMHTMQFFIPDGKYRKQVFALHVREDGVMMVSTPDILKQAMRAGILSKTRSADGEEIYQLANSQENLSIECKDGSGPEPELYYKAMTGWNRKAICITLPEKSSEAQLDAVEKLCALAAKEWASA